ncbi:MAG TPA: hypothetical protein VLE97_10755 [Gaiellaceae bacterium]|nr:hypothetical protein [Gaiellaceae bacterium]
MPVTAQKSKARLDARGIREGARVRFRAAFDRFPFFVVPQGAGGTVGAMHEHDTCLAVKLDAPPDGVPAEDDGCVFLLFAEDADIIGDMEILP